MAGTARGAARLAREAAQLLVEDGDEGFAGGACRKAGALARGLEALARGLEAARRPTEVHEDTLAAEAHLREAVAALQPHFGRAEDLAARTLQLVEAGAARGALKAAAQHVGAAFAACKVDDQGLLRPRDKRRSSKRASRRLAADAASDAGGDTDRDAEADAEDDRAELVEALKRLREHGDVSKRSLELVLDMLHEHPKTDVSAVLKGKIGTRKQRRAVRRIVATLLQAQEADAATLRPTDVGLDEPEDVIGEGRFTQVLAGTQKTTAKSGGEPVRVAMKRVRPGSSPKSRLLLREKRALLLEAERWLGLRHENIVCLLGTCVVAQHFYLVMDRCDLSLEDLLYESEELGDSRPLAASDREAILRGVSRGLAYLHGEQVIHHDLNPTNVLLSHDLGLVKLAGFGLPSANLRNGADGEDDEDGVGFGRSLYMAPEVLQAPAQWTSFADIFSLAMIMWEIYHGEPPYAHVGTMEELEAQVLHSKRPGISRTRGGILPWMPALIEQCWDHNPKYRPSASAVLQELETRGTESTASESKRRSTRVIRGLVSVFSAALQASDAAPPSGASVAASGRTSVARSVKSAAARPSGAQATGKPSDGKATKKAAPPPAAAAAAAAATSAAANVKRAGLEAAGLKVGNALDDVKQGKLLIQARGLAPSSGANVHSIQSLVQALAEDADDRLRTLEALHGALKQELEGKKASEVLRTEARSRGLLAELRRILDGDQNTRVLTSALWVLRYALSGSSAHASRKAAVDSYELGDLTKALLQTYPDEEELQAAACRALGTFAQSSNPTRALLCQELEVGKEVLAAMRAHPQSARVQKHACLALQNLALNDRNKEILCQNLNAGVEIVAAMMTHMDDGDVQEFACGALQNLALNERNRVILCKELDAGAAVLTAMRAHLEDGDIQENACGVLWNLAANAENRATLGQDLNAGQEIVAVMKTHEADGEIQNYACAALGSLGFNKRNKAILVEEARAGDAIVAAMRAHTTDAVVQEMACWALCNLANPRNEKILVQDLGAGRDIVAAMRAHPRDGDVLMYACTAVGSLTNSSEQNKTIFGQELKVGRQIAAIMRAHRSDARIVEMACWAVFNLAFKHDGNRTTLFRDQGVGKEIIAAMHAHPASSDVQDKACGALWTLASDPDVKVELRKLGAVDLVATASERFPTLEYPKGLLGFLLVDS